MAQIDRRRQMSEARARKEGYIPITHPYRSTEESMMERALYDFGTSDVVVVDRTIWRHRAEVATSDGERLGDYREKGEVQTRKMRKMKR